MPEQDNATEEKTQQLKEVEKYAEALLSTSLLEVLVVSAFSLVTDLAIAAMPGSDDRTEVSTKKIKDWINDQIINDWQTNLDILIATVVSKITPEEDKIGQAEVRSVFMVVQQRVVNRFMKLINNPILPFQELSTDIESKLTKKDN